MRLDKNSIKKEIVNFAIITVGILVYSVGFTVFILPHEIVIGGMAGFSTLIYYFSGGTIPVAVTMYAANIILVLIGLRKLGKGFLIRTLYGMTVVSLFIGFMEGYFTSHPPLIESMPMSIGIGAVLAGLGIGLYYSHHGTCGGTDIVAALVSKDSNVSMGRVMMIVDLSIVAFSYFLPFDGDWEARLQARAQTVILGWLAIGVYSMIADRYIYAGNQTVQFIIISERWNDISYRITHETGRGVTLLKGEGYWTGNSKQVMLVWCRHQDTLQIYQIVNQVDPDAYITNSRVKSIYGNGFDHLILKKHKHSSASADSVPE